MCYKEKMRRIKIVNLSEGMAMGGGQGENVFWHISACSLNVLFPSIPIVVCETSSLYTYLVGIFWWQGTEISLGGLCNPSPLAGSLEHVEYTKALLHFSEANWTCPVLRVGILRPTARLLSISVGNAADALLRLHLSPSCCANCIWPDRRHLVWEKMPLLSRAG